MTSTPLATLNALPASQFVQSLDTLYEYSPWIVQRCSKLRPFDCLKSMQAAMETIIFSASHHEQTELLKAHPDLAAKIDEISSLTDFSQAEQQRAGFAKLAPKTLSNFRISLETYKERFGHPFILCVSEHSASEAVSILQSRLNGSAQSEHIACLAQVARIGWHRLTQLAS